MDEYTPYEERAYWLAFSQCYGIGAVRFRLLLAYFSSAKTAWEAPLSALQASGIGAMIARNVDAFRRQYSFEQAQQQLAKKNVWFVTLDDSSYPPLLKKSKNPPIILYGKGDQSLLLHKATVAVVGTRKVTEYGKHVTELLVRELAVAGFCIVSGLALGVDAIAHQATLAAGGKTIAVLGSGVDICTPQENTALYSHILENSGAIISEYPLGTQPTKGSFPSRNRIIAGLSHGILVTEGAEDSGSLITARDGFANNRKVFAVPGPITSSVSRGPIALIAEGAVMVTGDSKKGNKKQYSSESKEEQSILCLLQEQSLSFDELTKRTNISSSRIGAVLSLMEMKGIICSLDGGLFKLRIDDA